MEGQSLTALKAETIYRKNQIEIAIRQIEALPTQLVIPSIIDWAAEYRYLPRGTSEYYGQFTAETVPHLNQVLEDLHPDSPYTHISCMKSVQSAHTVTLAENLVGFVIKYLLGSVLFLTSTKNMASIRGSANIDTMIDHCALAHRVKPASNRSGRKVADNSLYKEFGNNKLMMTSYNAIADLKSNTFHYIIEDELDEAGAELKDQGDVEGIIEGRTMGLSHYKILQISTPTRAETSRIYRNFLRGDQNARFLPCPKCGEMQTLVLKRRDEKYGLTFTRETDKKSGNKRIVPESIRYVCKFCAAEIREHKKAWMNKRGEWRPQTMADDRKRRSYHSPGLISPFLRWERICQQFIKSKFGDDLMVFKDFTINYLGNPWLAVRKNMEWELLRDRAEDYCLGEVPRGEVVMISGAPVYTGPLLLFGGVDVQGDRLELIVTGFGIQGEKWIIDYRIFYGETSNLEDQCWSTLAQFVKSHAYNVLDIPTFIEMTAVDAGFDPRKRAESREKDFVNKPNIVYDFVAGDTGHFMAVMGNPIDNAIGTIKESPINDANTALTKRYMLSSSLIKEIIFGAIKLDNGRNTIHIPKFENVEGQRKQIPDEFYQQFMSERFQENPAKPGTYAWCKIRHRNEVLDTFVYSMAAAEKMNVTKWNTELWSNYYLELKAP